MSKDISQIEQIQTEKLAELGARLRECRESQLITIEQVAGKTMIQPRILNAIEAGRLHQLPEPVYIQGFIKRYADALGLNGSDFAHAFPLEADLNSIKPSWQDTPAAQLRPIHLYAAYVLLIVAAVSGLSYVLSRSSSSLAGRPAPQPSAVTAVAPSTSPSATPSASPVAPNVTATSSPAASDKPVRINVTLTSQSWLRIEVDGKTDFQGILPEGTQRTWMATNRLTVRAGNAGGVMLTYNEGTPTRMGEPGAVKEVTFSAPQQSASLPNPVASPDNE
ncbi:helix-turn-helix domain-containing protein [Oscillatoria sp. FACHB-1407]|uniref:helix-turn-helix domain-containing protein n=1 Tax=Oscillatoria sp. FACHB-1407 TaxID=2692847 RepID=UPI001F55815A|nr:RodZ domain-containing protein [Oscillatoria sp. FACHB-1407]